MDWSFIEKYTPMYVEAAALTVKIGFFGIVLAVALGLICALVKYFRVPAARQIVAVYIEISRNTPLIVQLFFLYFGLPKAGVLLSPEACGVIGLAFLGGSYMAESFLSGLESVGKIQLESAESLGLKRWQVMRYIVIPQAASVSVPAFAANVIFLLKETSVFSAVSLMDLMNVAKDLIGMSYNTNEALTMLVVAYLIIILPISVVFTILERRLRRAGN
ncbi:amino acid ABC transporter membrane protein 1 PAAT family (TC 3.A.1.3.-) [Eubacterium sp. CAG:786]|nr:amino acid ABC transporter membrane protein 1 PAAT family (TC 3.A.1.3.-) [Eubacterium sp. CAG:786]